MADEFETPPATPEEIRRWTVERGLPMPVEVTGNSRRARAACPIWVAKSRVGERLEAAERQHGFHSPEAVRLRRRARDVQDRLSAIVGKGREELIALESRRTTEGLNAISLMRY